MWAIGFVLPEHLYVHVNLSHWLHQAPVILWSSPVGKVSEWREGHASVSATYFMIQVDAVFGTQDNTSFVAFDDFSIHFGTCGGSG